MFVTARSMGLRPSTKANLLAVLQVLLALEALSSPAAIVSAPIVNLGYAQYQGSIDTTTNTTSFLGIRYAAPPVGAFSSVCFTQYQLMHQAHRRLEMGSSAASIGRLWGSTSYHATKRMQSSTRGQLFDKFV
jgi:hypothetical protein